MMLETDLDLMASHPSPDPDGSSLYSDEEEEEEDEENDSNDDESGEENYATPLNELNNDTDDYDDDGYGDSDFEDAGVDVLDSNYIAATNTGSSSIIPIKMWTTGSTINTPGSKKPTTNVSSVFDDMLEGADEGMLNYIARATEGDDDEDEDDEEEEEESEEEDEAAVADAKDDEDDLEEEEGEESAGFALRLPVLTLRFAFKSP
jgi:hypothetical protein